MYMVDAWIWAWCLSMSSILVLCVVYYIIYVTSVGFWCMISAITTSFFISKVSHAFLGCSMLHVKMASVIYPCWKKEALVLPPWWRVLWRWCLLEMCVCALVAIASWVNTWFVYNDPWLTAAAGFLLLINRLLLAPVLGCRCGGSGGAPLFETAGGSPLEAR